MTDEHIFSVVLLFDVSVWGGGKKKSGELWVVCSVCEGGVK